MSCATKYENAPCDPNAPSSSDKMKDADKRSVSWGIFQVNISTDDLNYPACMATNGSQKLNCTKAFKNGGYTPNNHATLVNDEALYAKCVAAATNIACNTAAAKAIFNLRVNARPPQNPLSAWGDSANKNCSALLVPGPIASSLWSSFLASVLSSFTLLL